MKKQKAMSSKQRRLAAAWLPHFQGLMNKPQRGVITYGAGLNILAWIEDAEAQGYHCTMMPIGVVLR